jgi:hypothetical protein
MPSRRKPSSLGLVLIIAVALGFIHLLSGTEPNSTPNSSYTTKQSAITSPHATAESSLIGDVRPLRSQTSEYAPTTNPPEKTDTGRYYINKDGERVPSPTYSRRSHRALAHGVVTALTASAGIEEAPAHTTGEWQNGSDP